MTDKELVKVDESNLPTSVDLLLKYSWGEGARELLMASELPSGTALLDLAIECYSHGLSDTEVYVLLTRAYQGWKVSEGVDIYEMMELAKNGARSERRTKLMTVGELLDSDIQMEWLIPGLLPKGGVLAFSGEPGVGKTQGMMQLCVSLCTGNDFLSYKVSTHTPLKILFISLEMVDVELKEFLEKITDGLGEEDKKLFRDNVVIYTHGEALYLNYTEHQEEYWRMIREVKPDGIIIDSWSTALMGTLNDDVATRDAMNFLNAIRKLTGCFVGIINHNRKRGGNDDGRERQTTQDDILGSRFFTAQVSNAVVMIKHRGKEEDHVEFHPVKSRFSKLARDPIVARRTLHLSYILTGRNVADSVVTSILQNNPKAKKEIRDKVQSTAFGELLGVGGAFKVHIPRQVADLPDFDPAIIENDVPGTGM